MDLLGLNESERERLNEAGFDAGVVAAVAGEAASMRFLWLRRSGFNAVTGIAGAAGAVVVANLFADAIGPFGAWLPVLLPLGAAILGVGPWWEIQQVKSQSRPRWAARKLAALAVAADPDDDADDEWMELQKLAAAVADAPSAPEALNAVADALDEEDLGAVFSAAFSEASQSGSDTARTPPAQSSTASGPVAGAQRRNPAPSRADPAPARSMTASARDRLFDAIRTGVIITALVVLLVLLLVRRQMGL